MVTACRVRLIVIRFCLYAAIASAAGCATYTISGTVASYNYPVAIFNNGALVATLAGTNPKTNPFSLLRPVATTG
jgi:hypothetical protein